MTLIYLITNTYRAEDAKDTFSLLRNTEKSLNSKVLASIDGAYVALIVPEFE